MDEWKVETKHPFGNGDFPYFVGVAGWNGIMKWYMHFIKYVRPFEEEEDNPDFWLTGYVDW